MMTNSVRGILENRTAALLAALILSAISAQSWLGGTRPAPFPGSLVELFGLAGSLFITTSIAYRSRFVWDRAVSVLVAAALVLAGIKDVFSLGPSTVLAVGAVKASLWTVAAGAAMIPFTRGMRYDRHR